MTKNKWSNLSFIGLAQVVATFTIFLSLVTLFESHHRYLEQFSHFKIQYLVASFTCALVFLFSKSYKTTVLLVLIAGLNASFIAPWYLSDSKKPSLEKKTDLSLLLSNVLTENNDFKAFIELVEKEAPDVFVMQEVNQKWLSEIQQLEALYTHKHTIPRGDNFGIAIFSQHELQSITVLRSGVYEIPSLMVQLSLSGQPITLIATHPLPPVNKDYYTARNDQINEIAKISRQHQGSLIVIGDLNVSMWSNDYSPLEKDTGLRNARKGFGLLPTWLAGFKWPVFMIPLDHVMISSHFVVDEIRVGANIGSDHLPLIVKLGIESLDY